MIRPTSIERQDEAIATAARVAQTPLPLQPRLAPWLTLVELGDGRLQLRSAEFAFTLGHPFLVDVFRRIEPLLDGSRTVDEIAAVRGRDIQPTTIIFLLQLLRANGCLHAGEVATPLSADELSVWGRQLRFLSRFVQDPAAAQRALSAARVTILGSDDLMQAIELALAACGVVDVVSLAPEDREVIAEPEAGRLLPELQGIDLLIAGLDSPSFAIFDAVNLACLESGTRWLRVAISGTVAQLGPTFLPYHSACYTCFDLRVRSHEPELDAFLAYRSSPQPQDEGLLAPLVSVLAGHVALEVARLITGFSPPSTIGRFYELGARSPVVTGHDVLKVPRCPSCGRGSSPREAWDQALVTEAGEP